MSRVVNTFLIAPETPYLNLESISGLWQVSSLQASNLSQVWSLEFWNSSATTVWVPDSSSLWYKLFCRCRHSGTNCYNWACYESVCQAVSNTAVLEETALGPNNYLNYARHRRDHKVFIVNWVEMIAEDFNNHIWSFQSVLVLFIGNFLVFYFLNYPDIHAVFSDAVKCLAECRQTYLNSGERG